jgi:hypothetical protein
VTKTGKLFDIAERGLFFPTSSDDTPAQRRQLRRNGRNT